MAIEPSFAQTQEIDALPTPNLPLLRKVLDHIDAHPEEWRQGGWAIETECGTACCIAGFAVAMTEGLVKDSIGDLEPASGREWPVAGRAALGITEAESGTGSFISPGLFCQDNSRAEVQAIAESIAARGGERL